ncbi:MAG TPA: GNAT family N-acetyltransferase [Polyangiaceae bacterium]|nr:GNAT family N-acetyltransferase [Polyangiaceae bacterium]
MPHFSLLAPTLHTARLRLRPFAESDAGALFELQSNSRVLRYWDAPPWSEFAQATRFIARCREIEREGTGTRLVIELAATGEFVGWCCLAQWNPEYRSATMGYCLREESWGKGVATEAAGALLRWAFATLDLNRVQGETDTRNPGSARVLEKLGFLREGTLRENCIVAREVSDSWIYGLLRRDFAEGRRS